MVREVGMAAQRAEAPPATRKRPLACSRASADRKSTRLNSSHGYISYAVFCLKKKKKTGFHLLSGSFGSACTSHTHSWSSKRATTPACRSIFYLPSALVSDRFQRPAGAVVLT